LQKLLQVCWLAALLMRHGPRQWFAHGRSGFAATFHSEFSPYCAVVGTAKLVCG
jgi:hypothetical protein